MGGKKKNQSRSTTKKKEEKTKTNKCGTMITSGCASEENRVYRLTFSGDINFNSVVVFGGERGLVGGEDGDLGGREVLGLAGVCSLGVIRGVRSKAPDMLMRSNALVLRKKMISAKKQS